MTYLFPSKIQFHSCCRSEWNTRARISHTNDDDTFQWFRCSVAISVCISGSATVRFSCAPNRQTDRDDGRMWHTFHVSSCNFMWLNDTRFWLAVTPLYVMYEPEDYDKIYFNAVATYGIHIFHLAFRRKRKSHERTTTQDTKYMVVVVVVCGRGQCRNMEHTYGRDTYICKIVHIFHLDFIPVLLDATLHSRCTRIHT